MEDNQIMVSICCITYNHEKYIRQALDGFLMQKTNFKYEIIIHDDASNDRTADIIREYEKKYPEIIKPIYQVENQLKKGIKGSLIAYNHAKGKYIALCEGDDYWCDENKLQMQVDYLENNKDCTFCFHNAKIYDMKTNKFYKWNLENKMFKKKNRIYNAGELDLYGFIPTASFIFKTEYIKQLPEWTKTAVVGDRTIKLIMSSYGYAYQINKVMSVYRIGTGNSATDKTLKESKNLEKAFRYYDRVENIIDNFNEFTSYKYNSLLQISKDEVEKNRLIVSEDYKKIIYNKKYRIFLDKKTLVRFWVKVNMPYVYKKLKTFKFG